METKKKCACGKEGTFTVTTKPTSTLYESYNIGEVLCDTCVHLKPSKQEVQE